MANSSLARNVVANFGGFVVSAAIALLLTPLLIHNLGNERYGAWSIVVQLVGYYGLLDLGIRGALSHYLARYSATESTDELRETFASAFWMLTAVGALVVVVGVGFAVLLPEAFGFGVNDPREAQLALLVLSAGIAISIPAATLTSVLIASMRLDLVNAIEISTRIVSACFIYRAMRNGEGLLALATIQTVAMALVWGLTALCARWTVGWLTVQPRWTRMRSAKQLVAYGSKNWVINLTFFGIDQVDLVIVGAFLGITWVTYYSIGASLIAYAWTASAALALAFTPHMVHLHAAGSHAELKRLFLQGERLVGLFSSILFAGILVFGTVFIDLWVGKHYVSGAFGWRSDTIMSVLALANLPRVYQGIARQLLFATRLQKRLMYIMLAEALGNVALSLLLVHRLGPIGVAVGTLIPCLISHAIVLPAYVLRNFGIGIRQYLRDGIGPPLLVAAMLYLIGTAIVRAVAIDSWPRLVLAGFVFLSLGVLLSIGIGTTRQERRSVWAWLARARLGRPS